MANTRADGLALLRRTLARIDGPFTLLQSRDALLLQSRTIRGQLRHPPLDLGPSSFTALL